jgi:hypothetical protein
MSYDTAVTTAKVGTIVGGSTTVIADVVNNIPVAIYGLCATIAFGLFGLAVTFYFKNKEYRIKLAEFKAAHRGADPDDFLDTKQ